MKRYYRLLILLVMPALLFVAVLPLMPLMDPDEGRYALIPREMNERGDYVTPHLKGVVYLEKPPLGYWFTAFFFRVLGENEITARLATGLSAWGLVILLYVIGRTLRNEEMGLLAAAVFSVSLLPFSLARINILDVPLTLFLSLAVWCGYRSFRSEKKRLWLYGMYFFSSCAFLTKGLIGLVFPFTICGLWLGWEKRWRELPALFSPVGFVIVCLFIGPWLWAVQKANPDFFEFFFWREHLLRYTTYIHEKGQPFYFFLPILLAGALPWWFYLPRVFNREDMRSIWEAIKRKSFLKLLVVWILFPFFFFSLSSSKLIPYILPIFPPLAVFLAWLFLNGREKTNSERKLDGWPALQSVLFMVLVFAPFFVPDWKDILPLPWIYYAIPVIIQAFIMLFDISIKESDLTNRYIRAYFGYALFLMAILPVVSHYLTPVKSAYQLAQAVKRYVPEGEPLYQLRTSMYSLDFYTRRRTALVDELGELAPGVKKLAPEERRRYFPTGSEFLTEVRKKGALYAVADRKEHWMWLTKEGMGIKLLWENKKFYMFQVWDRKKGEGAS
ncbi:MAG TPA: glycosyltransferase family 39 protein [Syntrophales bacterium]|nr:glycosyltransferase family 39 protein [Syntrophales bacterium]HPO36151.1 glycosyltransferase family 39 protein [Syntrophales bacterium]